jgi:hypothetical protein
MNNIDDPNVDIAKSKAFLDPLLEGLYEEERKIDLIIFQTASSKRFLRATFQGALRDAN